MDDNENQRNQSQKTSTLNDNIVKDVANVVNDNENQNNQSQNLQLLQQPRMFLKYLKQKPKSLARSRRRLVIKKKLSN